MRVLLVNPDRSGVRAPNLPLGYLASACEAAGHEVALADVTQRGRTPADVERQVLEGWDVVGFQAYSAGVDEARRLARRLRAERPATRILFGGRHASALPGELMAQEPAIDAVLASECEETLPLLLQRLGAGEEPADVANAWYRRNGDVLRGPAGPLPDLDRIAFPSWRLFEPGLYPVTPQGGFLKALPAAPVITSRGCPYTCRFCASGVNGSRAVRFRDPESVVDEMDLLVRRYGVREIQFLDDNLTLKKSHAMAVAEAILRRGLRVAISIPNGVRLDRLDRDVVTALESAGCYSLTVGIDSGSPRVLAAMDRAITVEKMLEGLEVIKRHTRIRTTGNFILGLPGETSEDLRKTIDFACAAPLDRAYFGYYLPLPGSELFDELRAAGRLEGLSYADLTPIARHIPYVTPGLTEPQLRRALWRAYLEFYGRPRIALGVLREVQGAQHAAFLALKTAWRLFGRD
jgi:radical SAM superfamily enzyme YgiQ (UPF0313 family)